MSLMANENHRKHSLWMGVGEKVISFVVGVIVAAFFLGGARQKISTLGQEMADWKQEWKSEHAPRLERMDRQGTISFENFHQAYLKEQAHQYERLKHLEDEVNHLDKLELRVDRLEGKNGIDGKPTP
jgi:hypothetical protein